MKAEKTKELIELAISVAFGSSEKNAKMMHDLCVEVDEELTELEHKAQLYDNAKEDIELANAVRSLFNMIFKPSIVFELAEIENLEDLLNWHRKQKESEHNE